jgi:hypothetical protein
VLQIIGWLGCVYLVVKGFEMGARRKEATNPDAAASYGMTARLAWIAAAIFFLLFWAQASSSPSLSS